jgi:hypothetical protein
MKLTLPKNTTFWISAIIAAVGLGFGIVDQITNAIPWLGTVAFILVVVAYILLFLALVLKDL